MFVGSYDIFKADKDNLLDKSFQHIRFNRKMNKKLIGEVFVQNQYNRKLSVASRQLVGLGPRVSLLEKDKVNCNLATLIMHEHEIISDTALVNDDFRLSTYVSAEILVSKSAQLIHTTYWQPAVLNFGDFRISSQTNIQLKITKALNYRLTYKVLYDSFPAPEVPNLSYSLLNEILYKF